MARGRLDEIDQNKERQRERGMEGRERDDKEKKGKEE